MPIVLARIDDRLIHGQVTEGWCKRIRPDIVLVVSNEIYCSQWYKDICLAALPETYEGRVSTVEESPAAINELADNPKASYVLFENPADAYTAIKNGARISELNVGGMHSAKGKREILDYIYIDETDAHYLKLLQDLGVTLTFRDLPHHDPVDVMSRI